MILKCSKSQIKWSKSKIWEGNVSDRVWFVSGREWRVSGEKWRSVRKSEGESKPDAHFDNAKIAPTSPQLIHTASPSSNPFSNIPLNIISNTATTPLPIEFHTATDICFEIYLQIICITDDVVIAHSCFTTCASRSASRSNQEVVKKWA